MRIIINYLWWSRGQHSPPPPPHREELLLSSSVVSDSFATPWTEACQVLCPWDFPGKNTGVGAISFSRGTSRSKDRTRTSCFGRQILYHRAIREATWEELLIRELNAITHAKGLAYTLRLYKHDVY